MRVISSLPLLYCVFKLIYHIVVSQVTPSDIVRTVDKRPLQPFHHLVNSSEVLRPDQKQLRADSSGRVLHCGRPWGDQGTIRVIGEGPPRAGRLQKSQGLARQKFVALEASGRILRRTNGSLGANWPLHLILNLSYLDDEVGVEVPQIREAFQHA